MTLTIEMKPGLEDVPVGDAMHPGVLTCPPETPLRDAARMMASYRIHAVVVLTEESEADEGVGMWAVLSDVDLVAAAADGHASGRSAGGVARTPIVTIYPHESLKHAAELMQKHAVTHVLVVSPSTERPLGIVSTLDIARVISADPAAL